MSSVPSCNGPIEPTLDQGAAIPRLSVCTATAAVGAISTRSISILTAILKVWLASLPARRQRPATASYITGQSLVVDGGLMLR
jgi:hypothetical protein